MAINNTEVVNTASKYIVKSTGVKSESNQEMIEGGVESLTEGNTDSTASLIECYYLIEGTGTLTISAADNACMMNRRLQPALQLRKNYH